METKIIAVGNSKGGVGKTTTVYLLASTLSIYYDKKVAVFDGIDRQMSIAKRRKKEMEAEGERQFPYDVFCCQTLNELDDLIEAYVGVYDVIFLDMPPMMTSEIKNILASCDGLLIPLRPNQTDVDSTEDYMLYVEYIKGITSNFNCYGFINESSNTVNEKRIPEFAERNGIDLFENNIADIYRIVDMTETYISPYDRVGSNKTKTGKDYLAPFVEEFIKNYLTA